MSYVPTYLKKISKPLAKSWGTKQSRKSSYTIHERQLDKRRHDEHVKAKINVWNNQKFQYTSI